MTRRETITCNAGNGGQYHYVCRCPAMPGWACTAASSSASPRDPGRPRPGRPQPGRD